MGTKSSPMEGHTDLAYPLAESGASSLCAASGRLLRDIDLERAAAGELSAADLRVSGDTLRIQARIAAEAGYSQLASNLIRAAELTSVPNEELLKMYEMLRPGRVLGRAPIASASPSTRTSVARVSGSDEARRSRVSTTDAWLSPT